MRRAERVGQPDDTLGLPAPAAALQAPEPPRRPIWVFDPTLGVLLDARDLATPPYALDPCHD